MALEELLLEEGWWPALKEQQRLEAQNHSQVKNEMARVRMQQLLFGSTITPDRHDDWLVWGMRLHHPISDGDLSLTNNYCSHSRQILETD